MGKKPLRVVIVGGGFFGTKRLTACLSLPKEFRIIALVDPDVRARERIAQIFHIPNLLNQLSVQLTQNETLCLSD